MALFVEGGEGSGAPAAGRPERLERWCLLGHHARRGPGWCREVGCTSPAARSWVHGGVSCGARIVYVFFFCVRANGFACSWIVLHNCATVVCFYLLSFSPSICTSACGTLSLRPAWSWSRVWSWSLAEPTARALRDLDDGGGSAMKSMGKGGSKSCAQPINSMIDVRCASRRDPTSRGTSTQPPIGQRIECVLSKAGVADRLNVLQHVAWAWSGFACRQSRFWTGGARRQCWDVDLFNNSSLWDVASVERDWRQRRRIIAGDAG